MRSKIALIIAATAYLYLVLIFPEWKDRTMIDWDKSGYYLYLPAAFIYNDVGNLSFSTYVVNKYDLNNKNPWYGIHDVPETGHKLNKYPSGVAVMQMPFFLFVHAFELITHQYDADGYSEPYMNAVVISTLVWVLLGLFVLRKVLMEYFSDTTVAITLLLIAFATNLYNYSIFDCGMSHPYSFALFCFLLYGTDKWYKTGKAKFAFVIAFVLGLITIVRPTNIIVGMIPLLWPYIRNENSVNRIGFFKKHLRAIGLSSLAFIAVLFIQLSYWKYVSGHWITYSYEGEYFDFLSPSIWKGLFSYRKGWFIYTPLAFLGILGIIPLWRANKQLGKVMLLYFAVNIYVVFSWSQWPYGGSFGCRALIETFPVLAFAIAALVEKIVSAKYMLVKYAALQICIFIVILNLFQTYQFNHVGVIPYDRNNRAYYWKSFFKTNTTEEERKLIHWYDD